jgi:hypothetical protein
LGSEELFSDPGRSHAAVLEFLDLPLVLLKQYPRHNSRPGSEMSPTTRRRLVEYFAPHNRDLYERLGRNFGWDL